MSTVTNHDWNAGIRRERRLDGLLSLCITAALAGYALLCLDLPATAGRVWIVVGLLSLALFATQQWANGSGRRGVERFRLRHGVRVHVDPGPQWRDQADAQADRESQGWVAWVYLLAAAIQLPGGRWEEPATAVPGALLLMAGGAGAFAWYRRLATVSQRWLDDPPGPSRGPRYSPPPDQRPWTITGRQAVLFVVLSIGTVTALFAAAQAVL
jgi:hypothetical protein